jgi:hypothetical protein
MWQQIAKVRLRAPMQYKSTKLVASKKTVAPAGLNDARRWAERYMRVGRIRRRCSQVRAHARGVNVRYWPKGRG